MSKVKGLVVLVAGLVLSGCVGMRDSIPIMGESEDGKQVVIAHATRTRLYALSKAAEKIELWQVSSDKGVTMKGSDLGKSYTAAGIQKRGISYEQDRDFAAVRRSIERDAVRAFGRADGDIEAGQAPERGGLGRAPGADQYAGGVV